ncbi:hypothetical protein [Yersinia rohdei]|uniref:hypothetical protein n=1 Tax=Yersinia rohdei TaxID=29485 RepID=UPI00119DB6F1|nr:hypothetical protein [Yersinia rohdei]
MQLTLQVSYSTHREEHRAGVFILYRLKGITRPVCFSLCEKGGWPSSTDLEGHILYFRERLGRGGLEPQQELIFKQTLALLDPLSPKPGDLF